MVWARGEEDVMADVDREKLEREASEALRRSQAEVEKDPNCHATTPEDELEAALDVHGQCVRALQQLDPEVRQQVLESVARFLIIEVEPPITQLANMLVQTVGAALQTYKGSGHPADQQVSDGQGRESIVSLISKLMMRFPEEKHQEIRDYLIGLFQECYGQQAPSSSEPSSSGSEPAPQE